MNSTRGKTVVLGVTGGIAAYKALDLVSRLRKRNIDVHVIMTKSATEFVTPLSFQSLSQNMVVCHMFAEPKAFEIQHISLAQKADLLVVVPATANIIGKVANGIADDMLSTTIMATKAPVIFAPAMNSNMYSNPIVQDNINKLGKMGYDFINPIKGRLACGDEGVGKLEDIGIIAEIINSKLYDIKDMIGKKVLVTAGPTIGKVDPVRLITNRSSGKMGYAISEEARDRGAKVTLISGPTNLKIPFGVEYIPVETTEDMYKAVMDKYNDVDVVVKAAAVADYRPKFYSKEKIKKGTDDFSIELTRNKDILYELGKNKNKQILVGFAAESNNLIQNAKKKIEKKNLDYIFVNSIINEDSGFKSDYNRGMLISKDSIVEFDKMSKKEVAKKLFNLINEKR